VIEKLDPIRMNRTIEGQVVTYVTHDRRFYVNVWIGGDDPRIMASYDSPESSIDHGPTPYSLHFSEIMAFVNDAKTLTTQIERAFSGSTA